MSETNVPTITLNNGTAIPQLGFGVFRVDPDRTAEIAGTALEVGYRHIDTAAGYRNEAGVGDAVRASGIDRDDLWITTKLANGDQEHPDDAFQASLDALGLDAVDLYLIHWPVPAKDIYPSVWKTLIAIAESGRARSIGVSNFRIEHLERIIAETGVVPAVNQVELHVDFQQRELKAFHAEHGIATEAWYPLGGGSLSEAPELRRIADAHGKTVAQVVLRWHMHDGNIAIPKSNHRERMVENLDIFDFELTPADLDAIAALDKAEEGRRGGHPLQVG
ncbi:aldo/keto reductase [Planctomonas sp. JC2975]|uniref:aldo/keto reductase n=1 Tax=Planctomonas sp. JC2975 TaxID=2729626 RepID=UPI0014740A70|nr:aldo/keto reductase [Planctomonas sp. JC2975]NNC11445.1 aldo/keto reductase [Planctomonas sp. JC2975]